AEEAPPVAVVNESMAKAYWPGADPLGKHLKLDKRSESWATVVGVVADARAESMENAAIPLIYISMYQNVEHRSPHHLAIFLRGKLDPAAITAQVRREVQAIDPGLPVFGEQKLGETVAAALAARRFAMEMVGLFALTALLLAAIGIYGVISFAVSERAHEIGVRLALGAGNRDIRRMVLRQGL